MVGYVAYNLGVSRGLALNAAVAGGAAPAIPPVGVYPYGWYRPWGLGLGWFFPFLFFGFWFLAARALFWRGAWRHGCHDMQARGIPPTFDEWHRRAHERMKIEPTIFSV
jgi:hypothetical protein